jgi:hypothetical protein
MNSGTACPANKVLPLRNALRIIISQVFVFPALVGI